MSELLATIAVFFTPILWTWFSIKHYYEYKKTKNIMSGILSNLYSIAATMLCLIYAAIKIL